MIVFNYDDFYCWARKQNSIYISEYEMPNDFDCVKEINHICSLNDKKTNHVTEKLFVPKRGSNEQVN